MGERAKNMENIFRKQYRELSVDEKALLESIKDKAQELFSLYPSDKPSRELALAKTKLEEIVMWAVKGITG